MWIGAVNFSMEDRLQKTEPGSRRPGRLKNRGEAEGAGSDITRGSGGGGACALGRVSRAVGRPL